MPVLLPVVLRCDGCARETTGEIIFQSKLDWDLHMEEGWEVEQRPIEPGSMDEKFETKVWCSDCKETRSQ